MSESWVAGFDAGGVLDEGAAFGEEAEDSSGHGDAMVAVAFDLGSDKSATAFDEEAVRLFFDGNTEEAKVLSDDGEAIAFFVAKFAGVADFGDSFGESGGGGENRNFVDKIRNFFAGDGGGLEGSVALDGDGAERFGGGLLDFFHEACAHAEEGGEEGGAGGV